MNTEEKIAYLHFAIKKQETYKQFIFTEFGNCKHARNIGILCDHHIRLMRRDIARLENTGFSQLEQQIQQFASFLNK